MTPKTFGMKLAAIMGPQIMMGDMLDQDTLFKMQEDLAQLMCDANNSTNTYTIAISNAFIEAHPRLFKRS